MKRVFTILAAVLLTASVFAQSPEKMSYQAVIRNSSNALVANTQVGMQISILQGSATGSAVYVETQTPTTNANGLVSIEIGEGTTSNDFATINWADGPYFIKIETNPSGGTSYTITGTSQLLSMPYALYAKTAANTFSGNYNDLSGAPINVSTFTNDAGYLTSISETDPLFTASEAANITSADITNLGNLSGTNTGDQDLSSLATKTALGDSTAQVRSEIPDVSGFLTSETDPTYTVSQAANITATDITNLGNLSGTNTGDQDISGITTNTQAIQDTAAQIRADIPDVSGFLTSETDPSVPSGTQTGQMQYWNGTDWITVAAGNEGQVLTFVSGVPTWKSEVGDNFVINFTTGKIWMDRNLGASQVATSSTDAKTHRWASNKNISNHKHFIRYRCTRA